LRRIDSAFGFYFFGRHYRLCGPVPPKAKVRFASVPAAPCGPCHPGREQILKEGFAWSEAFLSEKVQTRVPTSGLP